MEKIAIEEQIKQKEIEIVAKLQQVKKSDELWPLMAKHTYFRNHFKIPERDAIVSKWCIQEIIEYFGKMKKLILENLKKQTLNELSELLLLYMDKKYIYRSQRKQ